MDDLEAEMFMQHMAGASKALASQEAAASKSYHLTLSELATAAKSGAHRALGKETEALRWFYLPSERLTIAATTRSKFYFRYPQAIPPCAINPKEYCLGGRQGGKGGELVVSSGRAVFGNALYFVL